ncbi:MAG: ABC transporter permease, partial [Gemmatimonadota bacterium]|nr:ABC transporter permease [Gemmatimonadota bacterium]
MSNGIWSEIRVAVRSLLRAPVLTGASIVCLGLGIGATVAIYSAVHTVLLQPLPFPQSDRLATVFRTTPQFRSGPFSPGTVADLVEQGESFESLSALTRGVALLHGLDEPLRVRVTGVSGNLFETLRASPLSGRMLQPADEDAGTAPVAMISAEMARDRFGGAAEAVGQTASLDGEPHQIVGVLPFGFEVPHGRQVYAEDVWVPLRFSPEQATTRRNNYLSLLGRLRDGVSVEAADAQLKAAMDGIAEAFPELRGEQLRVVPLQSESVRSVRQPLLLLLGAVGFVLLIAVANVASLLLARGVGRRQELAVRAVLGAGRTHMVRPVLVECALLTGVGGTVGIGLAWLGVRAIRSLLPQSLPQLAHLQMAGGVLGFALVVSAGVAAVCALAPVWQARKGDPQDALRSGGRGGTGGKQHQWLRGLVMAEVALSMVLLLGGGLVIRGFGELVSQDPGFDPEGLLKLAVNVDPERYAETSVAERFLTPALDRIRAVPGVVDVGSLNLIPYQDWGNNFNIRYEGAPDTDPTQRPLVERRVISPSGFAALGHVLRRGRLLSDTDRPDTEIVAVANAALAARDFPGEDPVGKRFHQSDSTFATIVGVVANVRNVGPVDDPRPELYFSHQQVNPRGTYVPLLVRVSGDAASFARPVSDAIRDIDPTAAVSSVATMTEVMSRSVAPARFYVVLLGIFAGVALTLAVAGLYGVMNYAVVQRTREIGIRAALGSTPKTTVGLVLRQGLRLVGFGL